MRWFAKRWLHDELLELEDGTTLHYPHNFTGPGYILRDEESRRLEGYVSLGAWAFIGNLLSFLALPRTFWSHGWSGWPETLSLAGYSSLGLRVAQFSSPLGWSAVALRVFLSCWIGETPPSGKKT